MGILRYQLSTMILLSTRSAVVSTFVPSKFGVPAQRAYHRSPPLNLFNKLFSSFSSESGASASSSASQKYPIMAEESVMSKKAHGTSEQPVQSKLRWSCDVETADRICNFNRHYAEYAGYWTTTDFIKAVKEEYKEGVSSEPIKFYDSVTGNLLYTAPIGRTMEEFISESKKHGWPSFRDEETNWDYVRVLKDGECVSVTGTHLGHNLPDRNGNRYCINLVSVAGQPNE